MSGAKKRIGIFGGTFDPVHCGHLRVALEVMEETGLDQVIFVPAGVPPHKSRPDIASAEDRLEMVRLACGGFAGFEVSSLELERTGPSYTVDTLLNFSSSYQDEADIFFIMGMDAFFQFHTWREPEKIIGLASLVIMTRPGLQSAHESEDKAIEHYLRDSLKASYSQSDFRSGSASVFSHPELRDIYLLRVTDLDISGTRIRELAANGRSLSFLVPEGVEDYIVSRGLYR